MRDAQFASRAASLFAIPAGSMLFDVTHAERQPGAELLIEPA